MRKLPSTRDGGEDEPFNLDKFSLTDVGQASSPQSCSPPSTAEASPIPKKKSKRRRKEETINIYSRFKTVQKILDRKKEEDKEEHSDSINIHSSVMLSSDDEVSQQQRRSYHSRKSLKQQASVELVSKSSDA